VASEIREKLQLKEFGFDQNKPSPSFREYADKWIKTTVPATCKDSTLRDYQDILRIHVLPVFASHKLTDINRGMVKDFLLEKVNAGLASSTVTHLKNVISGVLNKAVDNEIIPANPAPIA
jgi:integrase